MLKVSILKIVFMFSRVSLRGSSVYSRAHRCVDPGWQKSRRNHIGDLTRIIYYGTVYTVGHSEGNISVFFAFLRITSKVAKYICRIGTHSASPVAVTSYSIPIIYVLSSFL